MPTTTANGIDITYDCFGARDAEAVLLVSGLATQMTHWSVPFCRMLAERGYYVIRFDNRDAGLSTRFDGAPLPDLRTLAAAAARGEVPDVPYTLSDMAGDAAGLLDALGIARAHVVGRSMGGMIAQLLASAHPGRVLSLVSIMSSTGNPGLPQPSPAVMVALTAPAPDAMRDAPGYVAHCLDFVRMLAGSAYPFDAATARAQVLADMARTHRPAGLLRHIGAIAASGDLRPRLGRIAVPTLVLHGSDDRLVPPQAGRDTAAHIPGAVLRIINGMGHALPPALFPYVVSAIAGNAASAALMRSQ
jgi:pimeloyl-ACP methyl ester carboxylesterase